MTIAPLLAIHLLAVQTAPILKPGDRVRVIAPAVSPDPVVGTLVTLGADTLVVQDSATWRFAFGAVQRVGVSRGRKSNAVVGAGYGLLAGVGVGLLITSSCEPDLIFNSKAQCMLAGAIFFGAAGTLVGAVTGAFVRTERWRDVPLDRVRMSVVPRSGGGVQGRAALAF
jgi:hypothetical protein